MTGSVCEFRNSISLQIYFELKLELRVQLYHFFIFYFFHHATISNVILNTRGMKLRDFYVESVESLSVREPILQS